MQTIVSYYIMDPVSLVPWLTSATGKTLGCILFISLVAFYLNHTGRNAANKVVRMQKSRLHSWLTWDTPSWLAIGRYVDEAYADVSFTRRYLLELENRTESNLNNQRFGKTIHRAYLCNGNHGHPCQISPVFENGRQGGS